MIRLAAAAVLLVVLVAPLATAVPARADEGAETPATVNFRYERRNLPLLPQTVIVASAPKLSLGEFSLV